MSISVKIPKEIKEYQEKIIFNLSLRQLLCCSLAVMAALATYWCGLYWWHWHRSVVEYLVIVQSIPLMAMGFFKKNGWYFEVYLKLWWQHHWGQKIFIAQTNLPFNTLLSSADLNYVKHRFRRQAEYSGYQASSQQIKEKRRQAKISIKQASKVS